MLHFDGFLPRRAGQGALYNGVLSPGGPYLRYKIKL